MTSHSNLVVQVAKQICRINHCSGLFDDFCQVGEMTATRLAHRSNSYIAKAIRHAMLKTIPRRQPESLRDSDFPTSAGLELSPEFYIREFIPVDKDRSVFSAYYLENISVKEIAKTHRISESTVYRTLSRLKKDFANAI